MFKDFKMDNMLNDIVDIFHLNEKIDIEKQHNWELQKQTNSSSIVETPKLQKIELIRLTGLMKRASNISGQTINLETMLHILRGMKMRNIINWNYSYQCPYCNEIFLQIDNTPADQVKICDTCQMMFVPKDNGYIL